jgi:hypothetical protein
MQLPRRVFFDPPRDQYRGENCPRIRPLPAHFASSGRLAGTGKGRTKSPLHGLSLAPALSNLSHSFESSRGTCAAARHNEVTVGVEDFKGNCISERISVNTDLDGPRKPVCLYPVSGWAKDEGLGDCTVTMALRVPPDTEAGSEHRGGLPCGRVCDGTPFSEGKQRREGPQHRARPTIADRHLYAPSPFEAVARSSVRRLSPGG